MMSKDICPRCEVGELIPKKGKFGDFFGCSLYPNCGFTTKARLNKITKVETFVDNVRSSNYEGKK